jgi:hypothetical protein
VTSVDKRRRERIRAKRALREGEERSELDESGGPGNLSGARSKPLLQVDGHVQAAPGRQARRRRLSIRREARDKARQARTAAKQADESGADQPSFMLLGGSAAQAVSPKRPSLGQRRAGRRRERLRREGQAPHRPEERVRPLGVVWISWRWLSGGLTIALLVVLYAMLGTDVFIVDSVAVGGERYLTAEQVFEAADVANRHLFWIDPAAVEARLESSPGIADAQVYVGWPPNMVSILISERDPALIWEQGDFRVWVDVNGIVMYQREERRDLLRIVYPDQIEPLGVGSTIDREIVAGALQLKAKFPTIDVLLYDPIKGLGYRDGRNWMVWFGVGTNMEMKLLVYDALVRSYYPAVQFREVDVSDPDHPVFVDRFANEP